VIVKQYGPGVSVVELTGDEVATAIDAWLVAHGVHVDGPRTITVNGKLCESGHIYVDPSGFVISDGVKTSGSGIAARANPAHGFRSFERVSPDLGVDSSLKVVCCCGWAAIAGKHSGRSHLSLDDIANMREKLREHIDEAGS
jgi:hypothetical protein